MPGLAVGGDGHRQAMLAHEVDRRRLSFAQHIIGAGQQHRDHAGLRHRGDARFVRVFEVVGRQRAEFGRKRCAAAVRQLIGMQLDRKPRSSRRVEHASDLVAREGDGLAKPVNGVDQAFAGERREHLVGDIGDIGGAFVCEFRRKRVRAKERRANRDSALLGEPARDAERFALGGKFEPIAGFHFDGPDALGDQRVEPPQRRSQQLLFGRGARRADGRQDSAAFAGDLFIGGAREPELEFVRPIAAVNEVRVAIDQGGRDPAAFAVDGARAVAPRGGKLALRTGESDSPLARGYRAGLDDANAWPPVQRASQAAR